MRVAIRERDVFSAGKAGREAGSPHATSQVADLLVCHKLWPLEQQP